MIFQLTVIDFIKITWMPTMFKINQQNLN